MNTGYVFLNDIQEKTNFDEPQDSFSLRLSPPWVSLGPREGGNVSGPGLYVVPLCMVEFRFTFVDAAMHCVYK